MENSKNLLKSLMTKLEDKNLLSDLITFNEKIKASNSAHESSKNLLSDTLLLLNRKNKQLEAEVQQLQIIQTRNNDSYSKKNNERLKLAKKLVESEQKNEDLENQISDLESSIASKEEEIQKLNAPSAEALFYEIVKGFGVEFMKKNNKTFAKIKNKEKNDVFTVEISENNINESCDKIWACME